MQKFTLLKSIASEPIAESDLLRKALGLFKPNNKPAEQPPIPSENKKEVSSPTLSATDPRSNMSGEVDLLEKFAGEVAGAEAGRVRVVVSIPKASHAQFLSGQKSSGAAYIHALRDADPEKIISIVNSAKGQDAAANNKDAPLVDLYKVKPGYKFSALLKQAEHDLMLLLDVPKKLWDSLVSLDVEAGAEDEPTVAKAASILEKMMHHAYYKMTLDTSKARKRASRIDAAWGDTEKLKKVLSPAILYHYPSKLAWNKMKDELYPEILDASKKETKERSDKLAATKAEKETAVSPTGAAKDTPKVSAPSPKATDEIAKMARQIAALRDTDEAKELSTEDREKLDSAINAVSSFLQNRSFD